MSNDEEIRKALGAREHETTIEAARRVRLERDTIENTFMETDQEPFIADAIRSALGLKKGEHYLGALQQAVLIWREREKIERETTNRVLDFHQIDRTRRMLGAKEDETLAFAARRVLRGLRARLRGFGVDLAAEGLDES